jgi:hypothetical protein
MSGVRASVHSLTRRLALGACTAREELRSLRMWLAT